MDRMIAAVIGGELRQLNFSMEIFFDVVEKYGSVAQLMDVIDAGGKPAFEAVRWAALRMANDGELCRRAAGCDHRPMLREDSISLRMTPGEYAPLLDAVVDAIAEGFRRETSTENKEVDLGLAELSAKKAKAGE